MIQDILDEIYHNNDLTGKLKKLGFKVTAAGFELVKDSNVKLTPSLTCSKFPGCCGISVLHGLELDCNAVLTQNLVVRLFTMVLEVACDMQSADNAFVLYSTVPVQTNIIRALKAAGFEPAARPQTNPNTGNKITLWIKAMK